MERKLSSLPVNYGGMSIAIFCDIAENEHNDSRTATAPLIKLHLEQNPIYNINREKIKMLKTNIKLEKLRHDTQKLNVIRQSTQKLSLIRCSLSDEKLKLSDIH